MLIYLFFNRNDNTEKKEDASLKETNIEKSQSFSADSSQNANVEPLNDYTHPMDDRVDIGPSVPTDLPGFENLIKMEEKLKENEKQAVQVPKVCFYFLLETMRKHVFS